jgi:hypothetical protein
MRGGAAGVDGRCRVNKPWGLAATRTSGRGSRTELRPQKEETRVTPVYRHTRGTEPQQSGRRLKRDDGGLGFGDGMRDMRRLKKGWGTRKRQRQAKRALRSSDESESFAPQALPESCVGVVSSKPSTGDPKSIVVVWFLQKSPRRCGGSRRVRPQVGSKQPCTTCAQQRGVLPDALAWKAAHG